MTVDERLKKWAIHFQHRILLQETPSIKNMLFLNLLVKAACNETCVENTCDIINYLNCNLPVLQEFKKVECFESCLKLDTCTAFDYKIDLILGGPILKYGASFSLQELEYRDNCFYFYPYMVLDKITNLTFPLRAFSYSIKEKVRRDSEFTEISRGTFFKYKSKESLLKNIEKCV